MNLTDINDIKALLARHGFHFSKSMGQNFLIEDWVPRDIADAAGLDAACGALEIGPGIGPLTVQLAQRAGRVAAVELDRSLLPILSETLADYANAEVIPGDAMKLDLPALCAEKFPGMTVKACANLPYNITTPVLTKLLESGCFASITVMIQREVARRICAAPGTADYGAFSRPQGDVHRHPARSPRRAASGRGPRRPVPRGAGRLCPAAQNAAQRPVRRIRQQIFQG